MAEKESTEISKGLSTLSELLGKTYRLNSDLLKEKDGPISMQQKYNDKCQEFTKKQELFNDLKKRMANLEEEHNMETNFITLVEEIVVVAEGTIFIAHYWIQTQLNKCLHFFR